MKLMPLQLFIRESHYRLLTDYVRAEGLSSPSLAVERLIAQLTQPKTK